MSDRDKQPEAVQEHHNTQLSDEIKFRDYLMSQVNDVIEDRLERRIRKSLTFLQ